MMRFVALSALLLLPGMAWAQEQTIPVYFQPLEGGEFAPLNKAIADALSQPPLEPASRATPHALIVTVPDRVDVDHKRVSGTFYSFVTVFTRDGNSLGQSQQNCGASNLAECTDQMVQDVKSAAAPR